MFVLKGGSIYGDNNSFANSKLNNNTINYNKTSNSISKKKNKVILVVWNSKTFSKINWNSG